MVSTYFHNLVVFVQDDCCAYSTFKAGSVSVYFVLGVLVCFDCVF